MSPAEFHYDGVSGIRMETAQKALSLGSGQPVNVERFVLKHSREVCCVGRQVSFYLFTEARVAGKFQIRIILSWAIHHVSIGNVQQVPQTAAPAVPSLVADAVFQDYVVGAKGRQEGVHFLCRPLRVYLINRSGPLSQAVVFVVRVVG